MGPWQEDVQRLMHETDVALAKGRHVLVREDAPPIGGLSLLFLGSGGNPTNVVGQMRQTGGFVVTVPGCRIYVDPGPGAIFHAARAGVELRNLTAIFISHAHTDHAAGSLALIEAMCRGMTARRGLLLGPAEVLSTIPPYYRGEVVRPWYPGGPAGVIGLEAGMPVDLPGGVTLVATPTHHGGANVGLRLEAPSHAVSYTSDTAFLTRYRTAGGEERDVVPGEPLPLDIAAVTGVHEDVVAAHGGVDTLILNVSFFHLFAHRHLTVLGAAELIKRAHPGRAVLTHFDPSLGVPQGRADDAARLVEAMTGVPTLAAHDGLAIDLREHAS